MDNSRKQASKRPRQEAVNDENAPSGRSTRPRDRDEDYSLLFHNVDEIIGTYEDSDDIQVALESSDDAQELGSGAEGSDDDAVVEVIQEGEREFDDYSDESASSRPRSPSPATLVLDRRHQHKVHARVARMLGSSPDSPPAATHAPGSSQSLALEELRASTDAERAAHNLKVTSLELERDRLLRQLKFLEQEEQAARDLLQKKGAEWLQERRRLMAANREATRTQVADRRGPALVAAPQVAPKGGHTPVAGADEALADLQRSMQQQASELREARGRNAELEEQVTQLQVQVARLKTHRGGDDDTTRLERECRELRQQKQEMEAAHRQKDRELQAVKSRIENQTLLQEQIETLQQSLGRNTDVQLKCEQLEQQRDQLMRERQEWQQLFDKVLIGEATEQKQANESTPMSVFRVLSLYQQKCSGLLQKVGELTNQLSEFTRRVELKERELDAMREQNKQLSDESHVTLSRSLTSETERGMYDQEIRRLRELLKTYDQEFALTKPSESTLIGMKEKQIQSLQQNLDDCRSSIQQLAMTRQGSLEQQVVRLTEQRDELAQKLKALQESRQHKEPTRDYEPNVTRVVHLVHNPYADAAKQRSIKLSDEVEQLRTENHRLRDLLLRNTSDVDQPAGGADDPTRRQAASTPAVDTVDSMKLNQRLKEMFRERIKWFREAVYLLTGYKVDLITARETQQVRLRSMFAESEDEYLLFQVRGEALELMDTPYAASLDPRMFTYLTTCNSVPAFLSGLTLELFERQTFLP